MGVANVFWKNSEDTVKRDYFIKVCICIVVGITVYLFVYFFIYKGCEELIKFWVLANLCISIFFTTLRLTYILFKKGKDGLKKAISK